MLCCFSRDESADRYADAVCFYLAGRSRAFDADIGWGVRSARVDGHRSVRDARDHPRASADFFDSCVRADLSERRCGRFVLHLNGQDQDLGLKLFV